MTTVALLHVYLFDVYGYCQSICSSSYAGACFCDVSSRCHHVASYRNVRRRLDSACSSDELIFCGSRNVPWFAAEEWNNVRGQLSTVDRHYGPVHSIIHSIGTHQVHHLFPKIPHYHLGN